MTHDTTISKPRAKCIKKMLPQHYQIAALYLKGLTNKEIGEAVGMKSQQVSFVLKSPAFQDFAARKRDTYEANLIEQEALVHVDETAVLLKDATKMAAQRLIDNLDCQKENIQIKAAAEILDRTAYPKITRVDQNTKASVVVLNPDDVSRISQTWDLDND